MKDYSKRKDFLPNSYLERKNLNYKHKDNKALIGLALIIVILIPVNLNNYINVSAKINGEKEKENIIQEESKFISINSIYNWVELYEYAKSPVNITNGDGTIVISDIKNVDEVSKKVDILNISRSSEKYTVSISKGDEYEE